jgi:DNA replication protein DnaC
MPTTRAQAEARLGDVCRQLKLPGVARDAIRCATEAVRQQRDPLIYLVELLETEVEERRQRRAARRIKEAGFPVVKTLEGFDFKRAAHLPETRIRRLFDGEYIEGTRSGRHRARQQ